jgi:hypothetical protein
MSYLYEEILTHPAQVALSGPAQGVVSKAPLSETDPCAVMLASWGAGTPTDPYNSPSPIAEFPQVAWEPRVTYARDGAGSPAVRFPQVGDTALVVFADTGQAWLLAFWPGKIPSWALAAPTVTSVSPDTGAVGATVTITGTNFVSNSSVTFGTVPATSATIVSPTEITAIAPVPLAVGDGAVAVDVVVESAFGASALSPADVFTYPSS